jgi:prepilin-type N-terminal cleavage/methylation domain-containing protein
MVWLLLGKAQQPFSPLIQLAEDPMDTRSEPTNQTAMEGLRRGSAGFTLIELMVVIVIFVALMAVATPATMAYLRQAGVRQAADQLAMNMQRAKLLAVSRNVDCAIRVDTGTNQYTIELPDRTVETIRLARFRGGVVFTTVGGQPTAAAITFNSRGLCDPGGAVFLTNSEASAIHRVRASMAGGISQEFVSAGN